MPKVVDVDGVLPVQLGRPLQPPYNSEGATIEPEGATIERLSRLTRGAEQPEVLDAAVRAVADVLGVDLVQYLERAPGKEVFVVRATVGWPDNLVGNATVPLDGYEAYGGFVAAAGHLVAVPDLSTEVGPRLPDALAEHGVVS